MLPCLISQDHNRLPATLQAEWNVEERVQFFWCKGYHIFLSGLDLDVYKRNVGQDWASPETISRAGLPRGIPRVQIPEVTPLFFTASFLGFARFCTPFTKEIIMADTTFVMEDIDLNLVQTALIKTFFIRLLY